LFINIKSNHITDILILRISLMSLKFAVRNLIKSMRICSSKKHSLFPGCN